MHQNASEKRPSLCLNIIMAYETVEEVLHFVEKYKADSEDIQSLKESLKGLEVARPPFTTLDPDQYETSFRIECYTKTHLCPISPEAMVERSLIPKCWSGGSTEVPSLPHVMPLAFKVSLTLGSISIRFY